MIQIDLGKLRKALPDRATIKPIKYKGESPALECELTGRSLSESDFDMCTDWQEQIIGKENILEVYVEETGRHWYVFLKRQPMELINMNDEDINSFTGIKGLVKDGKLNKK
jgi:hypothetical protein